MNQIIRVFPRRTSYTPTDETAFVGDPPLWRPEADIVHISVVFTWDLEEGRRLQQAWGNYYDNVFLGGPALGDPGDTFTPGVYVKEGVTFSSRGCPNHCPWCLVGREGPLRTLPITDGYIIADNNFLACPKEHRLAVYEMLRKQGKAVVFSGGLQANLVNEEIAEELRSIRIASVFLAADTEGALGPLERAVKHLPFLGRDKLRCYVMVAYNGETIEQARQRLQAVWDLGCMPFCQLYQPPTQGRIVYSQAWRDLARTWSRPAIMKTNQKELVYE